MVYKNALKLNIGQVLFCIFMKQNEVEVDKNTKKNETRHNIRQTSDIIHQTSDCRLQISDNKHQTSNISYIRHDIR